jgi:hypothetical protein
VKRALAAFGRRWAAVIGLVLTALGVLIGLYLPTVAARWSGPDTVAEEFWLQLRFGVGVCFILAGTALQVYAAWPAKNTSQQRED